MVRTRYTDETVHRLAGKRSLQAYQAGFLSGERSWAGFVVATFNAATNGYAQYLNPQVGVKGQVFVKPTLHGLADKGGRPGEEFSRKLACYVGYNYFKHGLAPAEAAYAWSSMRAPKYYIIDPEVDLHWGGEEGYMRYRRAYLERYGAQLAGVDEEEFFRALTPRRYVEAEARWAIEEEVEARRLGLR